MMTMELYDYVKSVGCSVGRVQLAQHIINHPEIGAVLDSQCGAQPSDCAYDTDERSEAAAPEWLRDILADNRALWGVGQPGYISAALAPDGWWWKIV